MCFLLEKVFIGLKILISSDDAENRKFYDLVRRLWRASLAKLQRLDKLLDVGGSLVLDWDQGFHHLLCHSAVAQVGKLRLASDHECKFQNHREAMILLLNF